MYIGRFGDTNGLICSANTLEKPKQIVGRSKIKILQNPEFGHPANATDTAYEKDGETREAMDEDDLFSAFDDDAPTPKRVAHSKDDDRPQKS